MALNTPEMAAATILDAVRKGRPRAVAGWDAKALDIHARDIGPWLPTGDRRRSVEVLPLGLAERGSSSTQAARSLRFGASEPSWSPRFASVFQLTSQGGVRRRRSARCEDHRGAPLLAHPAATKQLQELMATEWRPLHRPTTGPRAVTSACNDQRHAEDTTMPMSPSEMT